MEIVRGASQIDSLGWYPKCLSSITRGNIFEGNLQMLRELENMADKKKKKTLLIVNAV